MSPQQTEEFRARARAWLAANAPRRSDGDDAEDTGDQAGVAAQKAFQARLYDAGFVGIT